MNMIFLSLFLKKSCKQISFGAIDDRTKVKLAHKSKTIEAEDSAAAFQRKIDFPIFLHSFFYIVLMSLDPQQDPVKLVFLKMNCRLYFIDGQSINDLVNNLHPESVLSFFFHRPVVTTIWLVFCSTLGSRKPSCLTSSVKFTSPPTAPQWTCSPTSSAAT